MARTSTSSKHLVVRRAYDRIVQTVIKRRLSVRVPRLCTGANFTVAALTLVFFYLNIGSVRSISDLRDFLLEHGCQSLSPQPRHLGMQRGFRFLVQNCVHPRLKSTLRRGQYCLLTLATAHPSTACQQRHRDSSLTDAKFQGLCRRFAGRCAVCGSKEGEPHLKNALLCTTIERGHADPRLPLTLRNCLPMCRLCNCVYKDRVAFNSRGIIIRWLARPKN